MNNTCPECGNYKSNTHCLEQDTISYGLECSIIIMTPVWTCSVCKMVWQTPESRHVIEAAIQGWLQAKHRFDEASYRRKLCQAEWNEKNPSKLKGIKQKLRKTYKNLYSRK